MKNFFLSLLLVFASISFAAAQNHTQHDSQPCSCANFFSARVGVNFGDLVNDLYTTDSQVGFNAAALYNIALVPNVPIYLQSGLALEMKGAKNSRMLEGVNSDLKSYAIEIPVVVTFDIILAKEMAIVPELGLFYSFAFCGSLSGGDTFLRPYKKQDLYTNIGEYGDVRLLHRSDFGIRAGISFRYMRNLIGIAYDAGLVNIYSKDFRDMGANGSSGCWSLSIARRFN